MRERKVTQSIPARFVNWDTSMEDRADINNSYLHTQDYWSHHFSISLLSDTVEDAENSSLRYHTSENWKVHYHNRYVSCNSLLMASKIAYTGAQVLKGVACIDNQDSRVIEKVSKLLKCDDKIIMNNWVYNAHKEEWESRKKDNNKRPKSNVVVDKMTNKDSNTVAVDAQLLESTMNMVKEELFTMRKDRQKLQVVYHNLKDMLYGV